MLILLKQKIVIFLSIFVLLGAVEVAAVSPLKYYSHIITQVEATVVDISTIDSTILDTNKFMNTKLLEKSKLVVSVQKITLEIDSIIKYKLADIYPGKPYASFQLDEGMSIDISNPWINQEVPFDKGDRIRAYIKLVSTEQVYDPAGKHNKWWFVTSEDLSEASTPPRKPFTKIEIISEATSN